jgi:hypothetical protein
MAIRSFADAERCYTEGRFQESAFRKVPALASTPGIWTDLSGSPGNPRPNYYVGAAGESTLFNGTYGLFHGGNVAPLQKFLHKILIQSVSAGHAPAHYRMLDYLMFYPLIDMDETGQVDLTNTVSLPRFSDGVGVEAMIVATNPYIGGAQFSINYTCATGQDVDSRLETSNTGTIIGSIVSSGAPTTIGGGPFIRRPAGCMGVRKINSINFLAPNGGLAALVLVRPIADFMINEITAPVEFDFITMRKSMPPITDGAYVNMIGCSGSSWAASPLSGSINFIWG